MPAAAVQVVLNGLVSGLVIAVLALGFAAVYVPARVFYIGLAGVYTVVPFLVWEALQRGVPASIAVLFGLVGGTAASVACEMLNHGPLEKKGGSPGTHLISSLGIGILLVQLTALRWGSEHRDFRDRTESALRLGEVIVTWPQVISIAVATGVLALLYCGLRYSNLGLKFRALAESPAELALRGHNVRFIRLWAFALSGLLAGVASLLQAYDDGFDAYRGFPMILLAIVAAMIGGRHSFLGPLLGGILLGLLREEIGWHFSARWEDALTLLLVVVILLVRPQGLLSSRTRLEALQ